MLQGKGYWLDSRSGEVYEVDPTHNDWMLVPDNQKTVGLPLHHVEVLRSLDPVCEIDEIRMIGLRAGFIRIRDRHRNLTMQFDAPPSRVQSVLRAIAKALPKLFSGAEHYMLMHNMHDDAHAEVWTTEFLRKLNDGESVLTPRPKPIPENDILRQRMDRLMADAAD